MPPHAGLGLDGGRRKAGFVMVAPPGLADAESLARWLAMARAYVGTPPAQPAAAPPLAPPPYASGLCAAFGQATPSLAALAISHSQVGSSRGMPASSRDLRVRCSGSPG